MVERSSREATRRRERRAVPLASRGMTSLYTKNGKPLAVNGDDIFDQDGRHVGRRSGDRVYDPSGRYAGTIVGDTVVHRTVDSGSMGSAFAPSSRAGSAQASRVGSAIMGDEPFE
jgi:hypothetical protein